MNNIFLFVLWHLFARKNEAVEPPPRWAFWLAIFFTGIIVTITISVIGANR